jgi:uncharacterized membrane protein
MPIPSPVQAKRGSPTSLLSNIRNKANDLRLPATKTRSLIGVMECKFYIFNIYFLTAVLSFYFCYNNALILTSHPLFHIINLQRKRLG